MRALITGITGQDGSYLAELLLSKQYEVHGLVRKKIHDDYRNIEHIRDQIVVHMGDLENENALFRLLHDVRPDEIYNLGGQSDVRASFDIPEYTFASTAAPLIYLLEWLRHYGDGKVKLYQASSSELFGLSPGPQNENTPFRPNSPYAVAKLAAHELCGVYRRSYSVPVSCGILHNHESPRRGLNFVTRKITNAVARIKLGKQDRIHLGNITAKRDWGYAKDYVEAMWMMLQHTPADYVIGTGVAHSVQDFLEEAFGLVGLDWRRHTVYNVDMLKRPGEVMLLLADASKARMMLGWEPRTGFKELVKIMVENDLKLEGNK